MLKKYLRNLPYILIASGIIIIAISVISRLMTIYYQNQYVKNYEKHINEIKNQEEQDTNIKNNFDDKITSNENIVMPEIIINPDDAKNNETEIKKNEEPAMIGTIKIPKINIYTAILEGTDNRALRYTVGHYPQTAGPGEKGNFVLLGHRNYRYGKFFKKLDELEIGDVVIVKKDAQTYTYEVTNSFVVSPEDTWVLNQTLDAQITMITCTPIGTYTHRLVVKGVLIE